MLFFVDLGLVDDSNRTISLICTQKPQTAPSLPAIGRGNLGNIRIVVVSVSTFAPIDGASVRVSDDPGNDSNCITQKDQYPPRKSPSRSCL